MCPSNYDAKYKLIKSYDYLQNYKQAIDFVENIYKDSLELLNVEMSKEYAKLLILNQNYNSAFQFLENAKNLDISTKCNYQLSIYLFQNQWKSAQIFANKNQNFIQKDLFDLTQQTNDLKYKNKFVAVSLSIILPGLGKIYSKNWKDGLFSLIIVSTNSWQAYRGFSKYGTRSVYGWIFGGMAFGFYLGNIYGTAKAVNKHNSKINENIYNKTYNILYNNF